MGKDDDRVTVLLAAPVKRARAWYDSLHVDYLAVTSYCFDPLDLRDKLKRTPPEVLILDVELFGGGPDEVRDVLKAFTGIAYLVLPPQAGQEQVQQVLSLDVVAGGWVGDVSLPSVAEEIYEAAMRARETPPSPAPPAPSVLSFAPASPSPALLVSEPSPRPPVSVEASSPLPGGGRVVAFWSGPAGGAGCTTLALALSALAAGKGVDAILLAFSEPAVSAYLRLRRTPNIADYLDVDEKNRKLEAAVQRIGWGGQSSRVGMHVMLGPARPRDGRASVGQIALAIDAARAAYPFVVIDVPSLPPGETPWSSEPLRHATDIVLVMPPTAAGISATVEALATLEEKGVSGRTHLVLNYRFPAGGYSPKDFRAGVSAVWQSCPEAVKVEFVAGLPDAMNRGELPDLGRAMDALARIAGLPAGSTAAVEESPGSPRKGFGLGKLRITLQD